MNSRLKLSTALRASGSYAQARFGVANPKQAVATTASAASAVTPANLVLIAASPQFAWGTARRPAGWNMAKDVPSRAGVSSCSHHAHNGLRGSLWMSQPAPGKTVWLESDDVGNLVSQVQGSGCILEAPAYTRSQKRRGH